MGQAKQRKLAGTYPAPSPSEWATDRIAGKREKKGISPLAGIYSLWGGMAGLFMMRKARHEANRAVDKGIA